MCQACAGYLSKLMPLCLQNYAVCARIFVCTFVRVCARDEELFIWCAAISIQIKCATRHTDRRDTFVMHVFLFCVHNNL